MASGEDKLIARFFKPLATHPGALCLSDDAAFFEPPAGHDLVLTTDALVGEVHFFPDDPPDAIARKALRVNLSDLAAKGATPLGFLLTLALPPTVDDGWLEKFSAGLNSDCETFGCALLGGDTTGTPGPVAISVFAFGCVPRGGMVKRGGAKPGDKVFVSGTIGDGALGLAVHRRADAARNWKLDAQARAHLIDRYLLPQPRVGLADALRHCASAAMDVSDGLVGDLTKLCGVSSVSAEIRVASVPLSGAARQALASNPSLIETILTGGDDFEIVCAIRPDAIADFRARATKADIALTEIGVIAAGHNEPRFIDEAGAALSFSRKSFSHF